VLRVFETVDAILIAATPCTAPLIGQKTMLLAGNEVPVRPSMGILTQPISFIGLPVVAVPVAKAGLPIGVQIVTAPWREDLALRIAAHLEAQGIAAARPPQEAAEWT
ncbi:MAG: AtzE family amidohydrolase, partial [Gemmatimonadaceae bacterium]|nr:AtzE family amidohydrolase [Acetobacteraceae bacterium]